MKLCTIFFTVLMFATPSLFFTACSSGSGTDNNEIDTLTETFNEGGIDFSVIYCSEKAKKAAPYQLGEKNDTPLSILDPYKNYITPVETNYISPLPEKGTRSYSVMLYNTTNDSIVIESIELPDRRFKPRVGTAKYKKGMLSWIKLDTDSVYMEEDYRFIVNYKDKKYSSQTFHVNLYPDMASAQTAYKESEQQSE